MKINYIIYDFHFRIIKEALQDISYENGTLALRPLRTMALPHFLFPAGQQVSWPGDYRRKGYLFYTMAGAMISSE